MCVPRPFSKSAIKTWPNENSSRLHPRVKQDRRLLGALAAPDAQKDTRSGLETVTLHLSVVQSNYKKKKKAESVRYKKLSQICHQSAIKMASPPPLCGHTSQLYVPQQERWTAGLAPSEGAISSDSSSQQIPDIPRPPVPNKNGLCNSCLLCSARTPLCSYTGGRKLDHNEL